MKKTNKYGLSKSTMIVFILLAIVCMICYAILSFNINYDEEISQKSIAIYETIKDVLVIIVSTIGVNLFSDVLIEIKSKNSYLSEIMANDVVGTSEFYDSMDREIKEKMYEALEENMFSNNKVSSQMYRSIRKKLNNTTDPYYYTKCSYSVTCTVYDNYIEKEITRTTHIRSYRGTITLDDYKVISFSSKQINGLKSFEKTSLKINSKIIKDDECVAIPREPEYNLYEQNEYNYSIDYVYKKQLTVTDYEDTIIVMKYVTRTSVDDKMSTFRVALPCKEFTLHYTLKQHDKYRLVGSAYGFWDKADQSNNDTSTSNITIEFSDWIFKHDGATVVILDKK